MKLSSRFSFSKVRFDQDNDLHLLLSLEAPKLALDKRPPLNMIVALDVSSSMLGDKMEYVKRSALKLIDHLGSNDRLGIITFNHGVSTVFEPSYMKMDVKNRYRESIHQLYASGSTNFSGAMLESLSQAEKLDGFVRVIILTDGQPTTGVTNPGSILDLVKPKIADRVSVSAFGYGTDHDSSFLNDLTRIGKGNFAFVKNPDDALVAFGRELGGLLSCYAQNLKVLVTPKSGVEILKVHSDVEVEEEGRSVTLSIPDLYSEETRHLAFSVRLSKQKDAKPRSVSALDVVLEYYDVQENVTKTITTKAKVQYVKRGQEDREADRLVMEQVGLADLLHAQQEAAKHAAAGNFAAAQSAFKFGTSGYVNPGVYTMFTSSYNNAASYENAKCTVIADSAVLRTGRNVSGGTMAGYTNTSMDSMEVNFKDGNSTIGQVIPSVTPSVTTVDLSGLGGVLDPNNTLTITTSDNTLILDDTTSWFSLTPPKEEPKKKTLSKKRQSDW